MKYKKFISLSVLALVLSGCFSANKNEQENNKIEETEEKQEQTFAEEDGQFKTKMSTLMDNGPKDGYEISFYYNDEYFEKSASLFNKRLMMFSYAAAVSSKKITVLENFYTTLGFNDILFSDDYYVTSREDSLVYAIAHKRVNDFDLFSIDFRGFYGANEWINNFTVGGSGNHAGFEKNAVIFVDFLKNYLKSYTNYKVHITGYSRGGGLANLVSSKLMNNPDLNLNEDNLFVYTFAAPRGLIKENALEYRNIFNLVNEADIVTQIAPESYGLFRCGTDINLYDPKLNELLLDLDGNLYIESFSANDEYYLDDKEFTSFVVNHITQIDYANYPFSAYPYDICTREHYYSIEENTLYFLRCLFSIPEYSDVLEEKFGSLSNSELYSLVYNDGTKLYSLIKSALDEYDCTYDDEKLLTSCKVISPLIKRYLSLLIAILQTNNGKRMIKMHYVETYYVLLKRSTHYE